MYLLIIALTFVYVIEARGQTQFLFLKHSGCRPNYGYAQSKYLLFWAWLLFLEQTNISDVFKIDSRGHDKRSNYGKVLHITLSPGESRHPS